MNQRQTFSQITKEAWKDILSGKDIINYIYVGFAIVFSILGLITPGNSAIGNIRNSLIPLGMGLLLFKSIQSLKLLSQINLGKGIIIHKNWSGHIHETIARANKSVDILMSWIPDSTVISDKILEAYNKNSNSQIDIRILVLSPELGVRREVEVHPNLDKENKDNIKARYISRLDQIRDDFHARLNGKLRYELRQ